MKRCILCGKSASELNDSIFTEEHIIPKALGNNTLKNDFLCKNCNSKLGDSIDSAFINSFDIQLLRRMYGIKGRGGVPNPFKKGTDENGHNIYVNDNLQPELVPYIKEEGKSISFNAPNKKTLKQMTSKRLKREGKSQEKINEVLSIIDAKEVKSSFTTIQYNVEIDLLKRKVEILKIAYEYAYHKLGESYFDDNRAQAIRAILNEAVSGIVNDSLAKQIMVVASPLANCFFEMKKFLTKPSHFIMLQDTCENCLVVILSLFCESDYSYMVLVSKDASKYSFNSEPEIIPIQL